MKDIDLNKLKVFYLVALEKSLVSVYSKHGYPKSSISTDIATLEKRLDRKLFIRSEKGGNIRAAQLTIHGQKLFKICEKFFLEFPDIEDELSKLSDDVSGKIRIVSTPGLMHFWLSNYIKKLYMDYPKLEIELLSNANMIDFERDNIDVSINARRENIEGLKQVKILELYFSLYSHKDFEFSSDKNRMHKIFVNSNYELSQIPTSFVKDIKKADILQIQSTETILELVKDNQGLCVLPSNIGIIESHSFLKEISKKHLFKDEIYYSYPLKYEGSKKHEVLLEIIKSSRN